MTSVFKYLSVFKVQNAINMKESNLLTDVVVVMVQNVYPSQSYQAMKEAEFSASIIGIRA